MKTEKSQKQTDKNKSKKKTVLLIAAVVLLLAAAVLLTLLLSGAFEPKQEKNDHKGVVGVISDDWDDGIEEESKPQGAKSGTRIPGYSAAEMNAGDESLVLSIGNPKENKVGFFATLKLSDGTVLYESGLLKPGQGLTEIPLNQTLEKGVYDASVYYQCVLLDEENTPLNAAESAFKLYVN